MITVYLTYEDVNDNATVYYFTDANTNAKYFSRAPADNMYAPLQDQQTGEIIAGSFDSGDGLNVGAPWVVIPTPAIPPNPWPGNPDVHWYPLNQVWYWNDFASNLQRGWTGSGWSAGQPLTVADGLVENVLDAAIIGSAIAITAGAAGAFAAAPSVASVGAPELDATGSLADFSAQTAGATVTPIAAPAVVPSAPLTLDVPPSLDVPPVNDFVGDVPVDPALQPLNPGDVQLETFPANAGPLVPDLPPGLQQAKNLLQTAAPIVSGAKALLPLVGVVKKLNAASSAQAASGFTYNTRLPASSLWSSIQPYILPAAVVAAIIALN